MLSNSVKPLPSRGNTELSMFFRIAPNTTPIIRCYERVIEIPFPNLLEHRERGSLEETILPESNTGEKTSSRANWNLCAPNIAMARLSRVKNVKV
jgi:hypothetical protein